VWRETLLAKHVLLGLTKGYRNHPQLGRFKGSAGPVHNIDHYLAVVHEEAERRGYAFDRSKVNWRFKRYSLKVTSGQLDYEREHLLRKLKVRDPRKYREVKKLGSIKPHPLFRVVQGGIEAWEIVR
jgi:hypothetical protein